MIIALCLIGALVFVKIYKKDQILDPSYIKSYFMLNGIGAIIEAVLKIAAFINVALSVIRGAEDTISGDLSMGSRNALINDVYFMGTVIDIASKITELVMVLLSMYYIYKMFFSKIVEPVKTE